MPKYLLCSSNDWELCTSLPSAGAMAWGGVIAWSGPALRWCGQVCRLAVKAVVDRHHMPLCTGVLCKLLQAWSR